MCFARTLRLFALGLPVLLAGLPGGELHAAERPSVADWPQLLSTDRAWALHDRVGGTDFVIPAQLPEIARLPRDRQQRLMNEVRRHDVNVRILRKAFTELQHAVESGAMRADPEYDTNLAEVVIGIDRGITEGSVRLLALHEPILRALPSYARIIVVTPAAAEKRVRAEIRALGLKGRTRFVIDSDHPEKPATTRWVRDVLLVSRQDAQAAIATPLRYLPHPDLRWDDLRHLAGLRTPQRTRLSTPLFFRAGNLMLGIAPGGRRVLFVGADEFRFSTTVYDETIGGHPSQEAMISLMRAIVGADVVEVIPNSTHLFHVDMAIAMIGPGVAALLDPVDPPALSGPDRTVLEQARAALARQGFRIVPIPTVAKRISRFQSPVNIVPFRHRDSLQAMAMVPTFPDVALNLRGRPASLNALIDARYRGAGIVPIPVEDRFNDLGGNTHCAMVALH
jgi:hypothetical protein